MDNPEVDELYNEKKKGRDYSFAIGLIDDAVVLGFTLASPALIGAWGRVSGKVGGAFKFRNTTGAVKKTKSINKFFKFGRKGMVAVALAGAATFGSIGNASAANQYGLNDAMEAKYEQLQSTAKKEHLSFKVTEGLRAQSKQDALYKQSKSGGKWATSVKKSRHTSGNAIDIAAIKDGKVSWNTEDYMRLGVLGEEAGLRWGGRWAEGDYVHFEIPAKIPTTPERFRKISDYIAGISDKGSSKKNVSDLLFETATHESGLFKYTEQKWGSGGALSVFQLQPSTAEYLVKWAKNKPKAMELLTKSSGLTAKKLGSMSVRELSEEIKKNDYFSAAMARVKYMTAPGKIPSTIEGRAAYWSKYYQGTNNPVKQAQYINDSRLMANEVKASALSKVVKKHIPAQKPTQGLVNKVLHEGKTKHAIASQNKKLGGLFKIIHR